MAFLSDIVKRPLPIFLGILSRVPSLHSTPIEIVNPGGERNSGVDRTPISNPAVLGWDGSPGQVINDRTDFGNGGWRLSFEDSVAIWQMTPHVIEAGAAYSLRFDAAIFAGSTPGGDFTPDLTLVGAGLLNGDFNEDTSTIDSRHFTETPGWFNIGSAGDASQTTRTTLPADGTRNAVLSQNASRRFAIDTGHTLSEGEVFQATHQWRDASNWTDGSDHVGVSIFITDDLPGDNRTILRTLLSDLSTQNSTYETQASLFAPIPASADGKRLFAFFEGVDGSGDSAGFGRVDNFVLQRGTAGGPVAARALVAELYVDNGGARDVIATHTFDFKSPTAGSWHHYHYFVPVGGLPASVGKTLGVQFRSTDTGDGNFQSVDNVQLSIHRTAPAHSFAIDWNSTPNQVWPGPGFWGNRLHDWNLNNGRAECILGGRDRRTLHRTGTSVIGNGGTLELSVRTGLRSGSTSSGSRTGLLVGSGPSLDWGAAMLVHDGLGRDFGLFCGVTGNGAAVIEDYSSGGVNALDTGAARPGGLPADTGLEFTAVPNG